VGKKKEALAEIQLEHEVQRKQSDDVNAVIKTLIAQRDRAIEVLSRYAPATAKNLVESWKNEILSEVREKFMVEATERYNALSKKLGEING
jgi:predicted CopG family antitoxin